MKRIQDVHQHSVPDFGIQDNSLWEEITGIKDKQAATYINNDQTKAPEGTSDTKENYKHPSLWWIFYDCIAKYPKFE